MIAAGAGVPEVVEEPDHGAAGGGEHLAVHQLVVDHPVEQLVVLAARARAPRARGRRAGR